MRRKAAVRRLVATVVGLAVLASGCAASIDPDALPGRYRDETGGEVRLEPDGTFSVTAVSTNDSSGPADFSGTWEFHDSDMTTDFVYLSVEDGGLGRIAGIQLYTEDQETVYFRHDVDGPPTTVLHKVDTP
ncbi:hypothetical protein IF129_11935 [Streptomyces chumphonensis]|uniref:Secreted protein n=1 Tax=Streptomyces chumphonensis TaxID=1214925 RepID=A0A927EYD4_9ACTN|nr:hypothetical protein [Streptomyces chumphonensis]MBD3932260.1 hypothetical protein [Streptomyces chumphonensis]